MTTTVTVEPEVRRHMLELCIIDGCMAEDREHGLCWRHWSGLPRGLQEQISGAVASLRDRSRPPPEARRALCQSWRDACAHWGFHRPPFPAEVILHEGAPTPEEVAEVNRQIANERVERERARVADLEARGYREVIVRPGEPLPDERVVLLGSRYGGRLGRAEGMVRRVRIGRDTFLAVDVREDGGKLHRDWLVGWLVGLPEQEAGPC